MREAFMKAAHKLGVDAMHISIGGIMMRNLIFTATGCARCKITKLFMQQKNIDYDEFDIKAEGKDAFANFYRKNRKDIYRDADGVEFPVFSDGSAIRQGVSVVIGYLIAGDGLTGFIKRSALHGEWIDGFDISGGNPANGEHLLQVLAFLKQNGLKIQATTEGHNATLLEQMISRGLPDRIIMRVRGPAAIYEKLTGASIGRDELSKSITLTAKCKEYQFYTEVDTMEREDGTVGYLTPEEIAETAQLIEKATGSKKHPYQICQVEPQKANVEPLPAGALFKYRTAARRYMVMAEIKN